MDLPRAVQAQVENADRIVAHMAAQAETPAAEGAGESPAAQAPTQAEHPQPEVPAQPVAAVAQPAPVAAPAPAPAPAEDPKWEARFKSLQGMFNAEVPKLQRQVAELTTKLHEQAQKTPTQPPAAPSKPLVTEKDVDSFGPDLIDLIRRVIADATAPRWAQVEGSVQAVEQLNKDMSRINAQLGNVGEAVAVNAQERFIAVVGAAVPDWQQIDVDAGWLTWLGEVDALSGHTRQDMLKHATDAMSAERVIAFFKAYKATLPQPAAAAPVQKQPQINAELQRQAAPRSRSAAPAVDPTKKIWTGAEVGQAYDDARLGKYTREQWAQLEAEINAAMAEGRLAP